jgi:nucleotide-binding universal stress UspA family protein
MSVLVGTDGSPQSVAAVTWAAREARARNVRLDVLHVFPWPMGETLSSPSSPASSQASPHHLQAWQDACRAVARAAGAARSIHPDVTADVVSGGPSTVLVGRSAECDLVVLGTRGHGGFRELLVGSVALQVAGHASCPVVLVGTDPGPGRPVIVGVGHHPDDTTLRTAFEEAALHGVPLRALHAWRPATAGTPGDMVPLVSSMRQIHADAEHHLVEALAPWREKYPQVTVEPIVVCDGPRHALITASADAALLVTGAIERPGILAMALGSVTHAVVHHARCPVLVAR